ncbi:MAG: electron transport complex subunit E [bacterium]|nr:electron transport complex subunit E [bacterium]
MKEFWNAFTNGIWKENPLLVIILGLCPTLAVSGSANDAFGMSLALAFVLIFSNIFISFIRKWVPNDLRIPLFIIVISTFVTIIDYSMNAFQPELYKNLGVFVPLIVVNCIILGRAEAYAYKNTVMNSLADGLGMSIGYMLVITFIGIVREISGNGTLTLLNHQLLYLGDSYRPALIMIMPPGAFLVMGSLFAFKKWLNARKERS